MSMSAAVDAGGGAPSSDAEGESKTKMTPELEASFAECPFPFKEKAEAALKEGGEVTVKRGTIGPFKKTIEVIIKQGPCTSRMRGAWGGG
ncbi:GLIPR2 [Symbiodinium sp. CCMP2592]|nr:GLIPR2 [Symbiodinium sp. CCMP2592]